MTSRLASSPNGFAGARAAQPARAAHLGRPSSPRVPTAGQRSMTDFMSRGSQGNTLNQPRRRGMRPGQTFHQQITALTDMLARNVEGLVDAPSRGAEVRWRREMRKQKAKVSVTLQCDPVWLAQQSLPGLRSKIRNREEDVFKLIIAVHIDLRRRGIMTLVVNSARDAEQIRHNHELIRLAFEYHVQILPEKFHIVATDITKKEMKARFAGSGANINYEALFDNLSDYLGDWCEETGLPLLGVSWRGGRLSFTLEDHEQACFAVSGHPFSISGIQTEFDSFDLHAQIKQCYNCQKLNHMSRDCTDDTRCGYCLGNHKLKHCKRKLPKRCGVCGERGHASYELSDCPDAKAYSARCNARLWRGPAEWETRHTNPIPTADLTGAYEHAAVPQTRPLPESITRRLGQLAKALQEVLKFYTEGEPKEVIDLTDSTFVPVTHRSSGSVSNGKSKAGDQGASGAALSDAMEEPDDSGLGISVDTSTKADARSVIATDAATSQESATGAPEVHDLPSFAKWANGEFNFESRLRKRSIEDDGTLSSRKKPKKVRFNLPASDSEPPATASPISLSSRRILRPRLRSKSAGKPTMARAAKSPSDHATKAQLTEQDESDLPSLGNSKVDEEIQETITCKQKKGSVQTTLHAFTESQETPSLN
ncbi:hypothetical protein IL306_014019 [Fusarium sp. DS 682]|nr:hypothetical protein IL306_014019 [Fusarium sp. DS 682]